MVERRNSIFIILSPDSYQGNIKAEKHATEKVAFLSLAKYNPSALVLQLI